MALLMSVVNSPGESGCHPVWLDVGNYDRICADPRMRSDLDRPQDLGAGSDVDMTANLGNSAAPAAAKCDLVENQAVHPDFCVWMYDDAVRMGDQQPAADLAGQRYLGPGHHAPEAVTQDYELAAKRAKKAAVCLPGLVLPNRQE